MQWDVVRRTMEFFDRTLATLRTFGLSLTVALLLAAVQYKAPELLPFAIALNLVLLLLDLHYRRFMWATSRYALQLEQAYDFVAPGLTAVLDYEHQRRRTRYVFPAAYVVIMIVLFVYWATMLDLWSNFIRLLQTLLRCK
jgi:hypothetical protein